MTSLPHGLTPVFPLPNCVLLPGGVLPLHVFEPRYRAMVSDLSRKRPGRRLLAIALLQNDDEDLYQTNHAPIHPVVCVGEMVQYVPLPDGCCNIITVGRARARIVVDDGSAVYRRAGLAPLRTEPDNMLDSVDEFVDRVRGLLRDMAESVRGAGELAGEILRKAPTAAVLVDLAAYHLLESHDAILKQRILEEEQLKIRAEILADRLQSLLDTWTNAESAEPVSSCWPPLAALN